MSLPGAYAKGVPIVRKFPFAFNTPGLLTGHAVYTPRIGDILLDAWIEVDEAWDGTTPKMDFGQFVGSDTGILGTINAPYDALGADGQLGAYAGGGLLSGNDGSISSGMVIGSNGQRWQMKFTDDLPIKVCVSQDGTNTGDDPGSTQGSAVLYLVTVTPL